MVQNNSVTISMIFGGDSYSASWSQLFHSIHPLHVYYSKQPQKYAEISQHKKIKTSLLTCKSCDRGESYQTNCLNTLFNIECLFVNLYICKFLRAVMLFVWSLPPHLSSIFQSSGIDKGTGEWALVKWKQNDSSHGTTFRCGNFYVTWKKYHLQNIYIIVLFYKFWHVARF